MKDQEITVGSRWRHDSRDVEIDILATGRYRVFIRDGSGHENSWEIEHLKEYYTPIKETKGLYLYTNDYGHIAIESGDYKNKNFKHRSEHPISFVEVE